MWFEAAGAPARDSLRTRDTTDPSRDWSYDLITPASWWWWQVPLARAAAAP